MIPSKNPTEARFLQKVYALLLALFLLQFILGGFLIYSTSLNETTNQLASLANRVNEDISFQNGTWDTNRYDADPELPGTYPLYVLGTDGYVVDRWKPLHGFLDTSDAKHLLSYTTPQTISANISQSWRVLSKPITSNGQKVGVLTVAYFNPQPSQFSDIDSQLENNANFIISKISVVNGTIYTKNLDFRDISYNVVFQIIDQYNRIITKTDNTNSIDRIPNFIDTSYIGNTLQGPHVRQVRDSTTGEKFIVYTKPVINDRKYVIGVIVVGKSIAFINTIIGDYIIAEGIAGILLIVTAVFLLTNILRGYIKKVKTIRVEKPEIHTISFDKKSATLFLDTHEIRLPYATNQYYLVDMLFSHPKKRWELDALLEKFGEVDSTNWRKVYDAMNMVNKKVSKILEEKLIVLQDKTYQINPLLSAKIS